MNVRKPILAGIMGLATLLPCKAQRGVQYIAETGFTGVINKKPSFYGGMNVLLSKGNNSSDIFAGAVFDKKVTFVGLAINNYAWTKNISTWMRGTFTATKGETNLKIEAAPVKLSKQTGKFNFSIAPAYTMYNDLRAGSTNQGITIVTKALYSITPKDELEIEAKYASEPAKNLFKTHFGRLKDNTSYNLTYYRTF